MEVYPHPEKRKLNIEIRLANNHSIFLTSESANKLATDILSVIHEYEAQIGQVQEQKPQSPVYDDYQSLEEVLALDNFTKIILAIHARISKKIASSSYEALSSTEKIIDNIYWLEAEVNNGGFDQYFFNLAGNHLFDAINALETIGAIRMKGILKKASEVFPKCKVPKEQSERRKLLLTFSEKQRGKLSQLDGEFLKYPDDLGGLLLTHIKSHRSDISWDLNIG